MIFRRTFLLLFIMIIFKGKASAAEINNISKRFIIVSSIISLNSFLVDEYIEDFIKRNNNFKDNDNFNNFLNIVEKFGNRNYVISGLILCGIIGKYKKDEKMYLVGKNGIKNCAIGGLILQAIKCTVGRARPRENKGAFFFKPFSFNENYYSFPSGHRVLAFNLATIIKKTYKNKSLNFLCYGIACSGAIQRVFERAHFVSDVVAGAIGGIILAELFFVPQ